MSSSNSAKAGEEICALSKVHVTAPPTVMCYNVIPCYNQTEANVICIMYRWHFNVPRIGMLLYIGIFCHKPEVSANDVYPVLASRNHVTILNPSEIKLALYSRLLMDSILNCGHKVQ